MQNPFKINSFRKSDLEHIKSCVLHNDRLVFISPKRRGSSALVLKALGQLGRSFVCINIQQLVSVPDFAAKLLSAVLLLYPFEKIKNFLSGFKIVPTISFVTNGAAEVYFPPDSDGTALLNDVFSLAEKLSSGNRLTIVFDEFQEIAELEKSFAHDFSQIIQSVTGLNYIFLGSKENSLVNLFENSKSAFYHLAVVERLSEIPSGELMSYVISGLNPVFLEESTEIADQIVAVTSYHPFFTQQLAASVWDLGRKARAVELATNALIASHDLDYERIWGFFNLTDKLVMKLLAEGQLLTANKDFKTSTLYSSAAKLAKKGFLTQGSRLEIEDPFFKKWILSQSEVSVSKS